MKIHMTREVDGRWLADVEDAPGAMAYGATPGEAADAARKIAEDVDKALTEERRIAKIVAEAEELDTRFRAIVRTRGSSEDWDHMWDACEAVASCVSRGAWSDAASAVVVLRGRIDRLTTLTVHAEWLCTCGSGECIQHTLTWALHHARRRVT